MTACSNNDILDDHQSDMENFENPMSHIGEIHNDALSSIAANNIGIDSLCDYTQSFVEEQFKTRQPLLAYKIPETFSFKSMEIAKRIGLERNASFSYTRNSSVSMTADSIYTEIPSNCKIYIDKMSEVITANESDANRINSIFSQIDQDINNAPDLTDEEKNCLWACSAITLSSYMYNLDNISTRAVTAEGVVRADLEGAVGSFLCWKFWGKTAAGGLMFGPTGAVMTAAREIVKGAIVGSGVNVISSLIW